MPIAQIEYIWLDGTDNQDVRSKTRIIEIPPKQEDQDLLELIPDWSFDGSSTGQAEGGSSDLVLKPVLYVPDPLRMPAMSVSLNLLVVCEVMNPDGTPHVSNHRPTLANVADRYENSEVWVAVEQEYTLYGRDGRPLGWPDIGYPKPQGPYYCSPDRNTGYALVEAHKDTCLYLGLPISGINAEVMLGQWEYQLGPQAPMAVADGLILSRWLLKRMASKYLNGYVSFDPKPESGDWNGAGAHVNFSTREMREDGGLRAVVRGAQKLARTHEEHIKVYGKGNERRLTGQHETASIERFRVGESDRGASVRIPIATLQAGKGYLEDRRPAANMNPYLVFAALMESILGDGFAAPENV